ncbi:MAG: polyamine aminopropyltransferase [Bacillota bacterium]
MRTELRFRFEEEQAPGLWLTYGVRSVLRQEKTAYQELAVVETETFGRTLILDGAVQTTERDEFFYHEMITHVPMFSHPRPRRVLVVGGGDGGVVREVLKHPTVERVDLVEIDARVLEATRELMPRLAAALADPRVNLVVQDGVEFVAACEEAYDVAVVDSTDPVGPAAGLYRPEFYASLARVLYPGGLFTCQVESPVFCPDVLVRARGTVGEYFPVARIYWGPVPTYPAGWWGFVVGSHGPDPSRPPDGDRTEGITTRYYTRETHRAAFALPRYLQEMLARDGAAPSGGG